MKTWKSAGLIYLYIASSMGFPGDSNGEESACSTGDLG